MDLLGIRKTKYEKVIEYLFPIDSVTNQRLYRMDDCCLLQLPYWTLLKALLEHYKEKNRLDSRRTPPTVQVNLVSSISVLLQQLYASDIKNRIEYLRAARHCLEILLSDYFTLSYRPAYEHVSAAVDQVLTSLNIQLEESQQTDDLSELSLLAQSLLMKFDSQLVLAANQKKVIKSTYHILNIMTYF